ncbi:MAG TPA: glycosyltransferase family A protein [Pyrinomonadaceae bacterium]|jgi:glycosyltransferase involved in cell wall biosynthesis
MNQPSVSVIIPNYNYGRFLSEAIDSVLAQTYSNVEIVVVDDGSSDNSLEILAEYEKKGIKVVRQKNSGVGAARNTGVKNSSGDLIAFLDADDVWLPRKIEKQVERLLSNRDFGLVTCAIREFDAAGNTIYGETHAKGKEGWCAEDILLFKPVTPGPGSSTLIWRELFEKTGGFDERKEMHPLEDWEFLYRAARISQIAFVPEALVEYRNHGTNGHLNTPRFERSLLLAYKKIFETADKQTLKLRRRCYGNLYKMVAGSYLLAGEYKNFLKNTGKSLFITPENLTYFAAFPIRRLRKKLKRQYN